MRILRYIGRRGLLLLPVLLGVLVMTFVLVRVMPGDPITAVLPPEATPEQIEAVRAEYGLDDPLPVQFVTYVKDILTGNLGYSFQTGKPVTDELGQHLGPTLELMICSFVLALLVALPLGILSALRFGRSSDHLIRFGSLAAGSLSDFWLGLLLILLFYYKLGIAPIPRGRYEPDVNLNSITTIDLVDATITGNVAALRSVTGHLVLPVVTLAIGMTPAMIRVVRASAVEVLRSEAHLCAVAHGVKKWKWTTHYVLRQSLISLPVLAALIFGHAIGGAVLVERVYSWDGVGQWALAGLQFRNYPVIQAFVLLTALIYVLVFLVADVVHALLDPRVKL